MAAHATATHSAARDQDIPCVLARALSIGCFDPDAADSPAGALFYDADAYSSTLQSLNSSFAPSHWLHCKAVKSNPLRWALEQAVAHGLGLECASLNEVIHSIENGRCAPERVIFDSPCKSRTDLRYCLKAGVHINCDSMEELARVVELRSEGGETSRSRVGVRINPLLGSGAIAMFSVSGQESKFAIPLNPDNRSAIVAAFVAHPWLCCVHVHVGSQGCPLSMLADGASVATQLADEIDAAVGVRQVTHLDIGGGLPVNFGSEEVTPNWGDYSAVLRSRVPTLFVPPEEGGRTVFTEFGRAIDAKAGWFASSIEYVKQTATPGKKVALIHGGSDLFPRECYASNDFEKRVSAYSRSGGTEPFCVGPGSDADRAGSGAKESLPPSPSKLERADPLLFWQTDTAAEDSKQKAPTPQKAEKKKSAFTVPALIGSCGIGLPAQATQSPSKSAAAGTALASVYDIAGPLCFGGDKLRKNVKFDNAELREGDFIVVHDAGANTLSLFSRHCSRSSPAVYAYSVKKPASADAPAGEVELSLVRAAETTPQVLAFW